MFEKIITLDIALLEYLNTFSGNYILLFTDIEALFIGVFLIWLWLWGVHKKSIYVRKSALIIFYSVVLSFILAFILNKFLPVRPRPENFITPLISHIPDNSFPSTHALFFWASIITVWKRVRLWFFPILILGICMLISRVIAGIHYPSDIIVGFFLGIICGEIILFFSEKKFFEKFFLHPVINLASFLKL